MAYMSEPTKNSNNKASAGNSANGNDQRSWMIQLGRYSQIGFALPAATGVGWLLGTLLDRYLHTSWLYLAGLLCGIVSGFIELIRVTRKLGRAGEAK
jgi:F0F1-type ATP synthase assembly protein I